jgi:hypothetical protein
MTPYAVLLARPVDGDEVVRKLYHGIARCCHPDTRRGMSQAAQADLTARWHTATEAYTAIKTYDRRDTWAREQALLSGGCEACGGCGVRGSRVGKGSVRLCEACGGEGRIR